MLFLTLLFFATDLIAIKNGAKAGEQEYLDAKKLLSVDPSLALTNLQQVYDTFQHVKSMETIIDHYLFKVHDYKKSYEYSELLAKDGHPYGHFVKGVFLSANIVKSENNIQQSLIHLIMASRDRHLPSLMATGYRYLNGIGVKESCSKSLQYYKAAAKIIVRHRVNGPPLGTLLPPLPIHLEANDGGIYGHISHSKPNDRIFGDDASGISEEDIIDYSKMLAESGDISSQYLLGQVFYQGLQNFKQNYQIAFLYFKKAANVLDLKESAINESDEEDAHLKRKERIFAGKSAAMLGRMYLRGEFVSKNNELAFSWFKKGSEVGDGLSFSGLGYMYEFGLNTNPNIKKALEMYLKAAERQDAYGLTRLGKHYKEQKDYIGASNYLNIASHLGNVQASYLLGDMVQNGYGVSSDCKQAVQLYKKVAETGYEWFYPYTIHAYESLANGAPENALINYLFASEMGVELGQVNLAYLIDKQEITHSNLTSNNLTSLALLAFHRAANQGNVDARIKAGDYHYNGIGVEENKIQAFEYYKAASDARSSFASWNIGYMYENAVGVPQDYNMAMRYYDLAYEYNKDTWLVVSLSNLKLRLRWSFDDFSKYFQSTPKQDKATNINDKEIPTDTLGDTNNQINDEIDWEIEEMRIPTWKRNNNNDAFTTIESVLFGSSASGMDNLIFFGLILISGYLFYIRRRNQDLPQIVPQQAVVERQEIPNPRLNQLVEQMREQQRQRIINQQTTDQIEQTEQSPTAIATGVELSIEELRQRRLRVVEQTTEEPTIPLEEQADDSE